MTETTIVILIDALGFSIAERHGFHPGALTSRARLRTTFGFSQAALASILTGVAPAEHELWMMYAFARRRRPLGWLALAPRGATMRRRWLRRLVGAYLDRVVRVRGYYSLYDLPREILVQLDLPGRRPLFEGHGTGAAPSILDWLDARKLPRLVWDYRTEEAQAFRALEASLRSSRASFYLLYTAALDADLHRLGTGAPAIASHLGWYAERIEKIARLAPGARLFVLGDHGMCDVRGTVDLMREVDALGLRVPGDYVPLYDSTMARFGTRSARGREELVRFLEAREGGRLLDEAGERALGVFFDDGRFGDLIYLLDPGSIILPSHMGRDPVAGMHGYHPDAAEMSSVLLSNVPLPAGSLALTDVAGILCPGFEARRGGEGR